LIQFALVGRSNVGKSSLINAILSGRAKAPSKSTAQLREKQGHLALTSKTPGKTQKLHFFKLPSVVL